MKLIKTLLQPKILIAALLIFGVNTGLSVGDDIVLPGEGFMINPHIPYIPECSNGGADCLLNCQNVPEDERQCCDEQCRQDVNDCYAGAINALL